MIAGFFRFIFHILIYVVVFVGLVWLILGIPPMETYSRAVQNIGGLIGRATGISQEVMQTAGDMKNVADSHLQQAADRINGIDPYEKIARQFDADVAAAAAAAQ